VTQPSAASIALAGRHVGGEDVPRPNFENDPEDAS
jgi:hypothetical protein